MGCRIIVGSLDGGNGRECAVFYDSVTDTAFGPVMESHEEAQEFAEWLQADESRWAEHPLGERNRNTPDPRAYKGDHLHLLYAEFREEQVRLEKNS